MVCFNYIICSSDRSDHFDKSNCWKVSISRFSEAFTIAWSKFNLKNQFTWYSIIGRVPMNSSQFAICESTYRESVNVNTSKIKSGQNTGGPPLNSSVNILK